jgi:hypothetical protein
MTTERQGDTVTAPIPEPMAPGAQLVVATHRPFLGKNRHGEPVAAEWWNTLPRDRQAMFLRAGLVAWRLTPKRGRGRPRKGAA